MKKLVLFLLFIQLSSNFELSWAQIKIGSFTTVIDTSTASYADGSVTEPSITFMLDNNLGFYRYSADYLGLTCGGALGFIFEADAILGTTVGGSSSPTYSFQGDPTVGVYHRSSGVLGLAGTSVRTVGNLGIGTAAGDSSLKAESGEFTRDVYIADDLKVDGNIYNHIVHGTHTISLFSPSEMTQDTFWCDNNYLNTNMIVDSIRVEGDVDNQDITLVYSDEDGGAGTLIDAVTAANNGIDMYWGVETTISNGTIPTNKRIGVVKPSITSTQVKITIFFYFTVQRL
jgi:hypothetical protein